MRAHLFERRAGADPMFRWRGGEVSRIEGLSDGVFALTLTLLIVSTSIPGTFWELWQTVRDLPVFLVCFLLLMWAWGYHYSFFRRYGLEDLPTMVLNGAFLFLVLFYAYPTKFVAAFLWHQILGDPMAPMFAVPGGIEWLTAAQQRGAMMLFYGIGVIGVFGSLALLCAWAYRRRTDLELDELELMLTRSSIITHLITVAIALVSVALVWTGANPAWSGLIYFLMGPVHAAWGFWSGTRARRLHQAMTAGAP